MWFKRTMLTGSVLALFWSGIVVAQGERRPAVAVQPCNDLCRWWMSIGLEPSAPEVADRRPVEPTTPAVEGSTFRAVSLPIPLPRVRRGAGGGDAALRVAKPAVGGGAAASRSRALWNRRIEGSAPILTTALVRP